MKIVIDIPDYVYCDIQAYKTIFSDKIEEVTKSIINGILLPKGHGRLIDADALEKRMLDRELELNDDRALWESSAVTVALDMFATTIIEADKVKRKK